MFVFWYTFLKEDCCGLWQSHESSIVINITAGMKICSASELSGPFLGAVLGPARPWVLLLAGPATPTFWSQSVLPRFQDPECSIGSLSASLLPAQWKQDFIRLYESETFLPSKTEPQGLSQGIV